MKFKGRILLDTDYWTADNGQLGRQAWLAVTGDTWHLLLPGHIHHSIERVVALPVPVFQDEHAFQWAFVARYGLDVRVCLDHVMQPWPMLPHPGARMQRQLLVYANHYFHLPGVIHNFGHFTPGEVPISFRAELEVIRPRRTRNGFRFAGINLPHR